MQNKRASQENVEFFISGPRLAELVGSALIHEQMFGAVTLCSRCELTGLSAIGCKDVGSDRASENYSR